MFAIPGQSLEVWRDTLREAIALQSEHLSSYEVIYEDDTPLFAQLQAGEIDADEDLACAMYEALVDHATAAGFRQYEVANFARDSAQNANGRPPADSVPDRACRHNVVYWRGGSFYGLGPSATSYVRGRRTKNWSNTQLYCEQFEKNQRAIESSEELPPDQRAGETAAFGLRMVIGWPFEQFQSVTGHDLRQGWTEEMQQLVTQGWGHITPHSFRLTRRGLRFADSAAQLFLR
jgi:oxygen-independent coproporphyrinogen-3 oxidase